MKNEMPNSVLLNLAEYKRMSQAFEKTDNFDKDGIVDLVKRLPPRGNRKVYTLSQLKQDLNQQLNNMQVDNEQVCSNDF